MKILPREEPPKKGAHLAHLSGQILQFTQKYQKAIQKFQQAQSFLLYDQQLKYFNALSTGQETKPTYPFIINHQKNEIFVHLGPNHQAKVLQPDKVQAIAQYVHQGTQLHQIMTDYASVMAQKNERIESTFEVPAQKSTKKRKTQQEKRNDMATGKDLKETKNIPKNFSKAIITFVIKNGELCRKLLQEELVYEKFMEHLKQKKKSMSNIKHLSEMLVDTVEDETERLYNRTFRIISAYFLKKHSIEYIFNSRIQQINWHLKYRRNIIRALKHPDRFNQIKHM